MKSTESTLSSTSTNAPAVAPAVAPVEPALVFDPVLAAAAQRAFSDLSHTATPAQLADMIASLGFDEAMPDMTSGEYWPDAASILRAQARSGLALDMAAWLVLGDRTLAQTPPPSAYALVRPAWLAGSSPDTRYAMALARCVQIGAAIEAAIDLSLQYVSDRRQFGRPLSKFQAVQQQLAVVAEEAAAANTITDFTLAAVAQRGLTGANVDALLQAATLVNAQAVSACQDVTHQVHGAMGFTREYPLHRHSLNLLRWRDELLAAQGGEMRCAEALGTRAIEAGSVWKLVTTTMQP